MGCGVLVSHEFRAGSDLNLSCPRGEGQEHAWGAGCWCSVRVLPFHILFVVLHHFSLLQPLPRSRRVDLTTMWRRDQDVIMWLAQTWSAKDWMYLDNAVSCR